MSKEQDSETAPAMLERLLTLARQGYDADAENLVMLQESLAYDTPGDLSRWILDALDLPADDDSDQEAFSMQRRIQGAISSWFGLGHE